MPFADKPFGLNQVKVVRAGTVVTLDAAQTMQFTPRMVNADLKGNDTIVVTSSTVDALEWSLEQGGIPLDALAVMTGWTSTTSGSTPSRIVTMVGHAGTAMPWFVIYGKSNADDGGDTHVKIWKAKISGSIEGQFAQGEFYISKCAGIAVEDSVKGLFDIVQNETATTLPTS